MRTRREEFVAGVRAELPLLIGVTPFGLAYGAYAVESGLPVPAAQAMSAIVFAGASQFVGARQIAAEVPGIVVVLTALLVNARHALYSASLAPRVEHLPARWRWLLAYLLTDEAYAVSAARYEATPPDSGTVGAAHWYFLGAGLTLWVDWQVTTAAGVGLGATVPASWALDFALPLTFIAIVVPAIRDRGALAAAVTAGVVAVALFRLPYGLNILVPAIAGLVAAFVLARRPGAAPPARAAA